jgi:hypothetical protein
MREGAGGILPLDSPVVSERLSAGRSLRFKDLVTVIATRVSQPQEVTVGIVKGVPARPLGAMLLWPLVTIEFAPRQVLEGDSYDVMIHASHLGTASEPGTIVVLAWDGRSFRDVTTSTDPGGTVAARLSGPASLVLASIPYSIVSPGILDQRRACL